ncbi:MAG: FtsW/RodA/SpoVE family cell cycle protein [Clostridiales bacterium]|nr:FtsW/RodA/SpoVE family cell cycle protein [Clostridiales bacterium]
MFLIAYFLLQAGRFIFKEGSGPAASPRPRGLWIVTILFCVFAFPILAFDENLLSVHLQTLLFGGFVLLFVMAGPLLARKIFRRPCPVMTHTMFFLLGLGFVAIYRLNPALAAAQFIFAVLGFGASLFVPLIFRVFSQFEKLEKLFLIACAGLIGIVFIADILGGLIGIPLIAVDEFGAARWVSIFGISFQPSEVAKPLFVIYLACAFRVKPGFMKLAFTGAASAAIVGILVLQRDLGSALLFFTVFMIIFYTATGSKALFAGGFAVMAAASVVAYQLFPHLRIRVAAWSNPWPLVANEGFQLTQSLFAIATWGPFGAGLGRGMAGRIPVVERDIIFSAISEEFGWIFGLLFIGLYALILLRGTDMARRAKRPLYALMTLGFTVFLAFQAFVSIGGNIRLIPMTGITLPFVSYGGSSVFISTIMIGVLNWLNGQLREEES